LVCATTHSHDLIRENRAGALSKKTLRHLKTINGEHIVLTNNRMINCQGALHLDQGIAVTSYAAQGKTVDHVIVSVPVAAFSKASEAHFYVSISRARASVHLFTDSKVALKEAVTRPSERLSPYEVISKDGNCGNWKDVVVAMHSACKPTKNPVAPPKSCTEVVKQSEREIER
jgi:hypothetical protein